MTYDEAFDLNRSDEEIDESEIDPADAGDPERPLTPEEIEDLYRSDPRNGADFTVDPDAEALELDRYWDSIRENYTEENYR